MNEDLYQQVYRERFGPPAEPERPQGVSDAERLREALERTEPEREAVRRARRKALL